MKIQPIPIRPYSPPSSPEGEQSLLGAVLVRPSCLDELVGQLFEEDFYSAAHQKIYHAMLDLYGASFPVDLVSVCAYLKDRGQLEGAGGAVYLAGLSESVGFATNALYYGKLVREKAILRRLLDASQEIASGCLSNVDDVAEFVDRAGQKISEVMDERGAETHSLADLVPGEVERVEALHENRSRLLGVPTGFTDLDRMMAGMQKAELILLAARPSMGKTALALNIAHFAAHHANVPVAFFSLEMSKEQLVRRLFASVGRIDASRLRSGNMQGQEWASLQEASGGLMDDPIYISDKARSTSLEIRAQARRLKAKHGIGLVVVDYLQLMRDAKAKSREQEIARISGDLKALGKELDVSVLALSQLNREVEKRPNKRPVLADLRESGSLEQDADVVMFIYRDEVYRKDSLDKGVAEVRIAKQRNGPVGLVKLAFLGQYTRFENFIDGDSR
jgi:replicative DNA helicase